MKPGELERRLVTQAEQAAAARSRLDALGREVDAVRAVIFEIAAAIRGGAGSSGAAPDDASGGDEKGPPYAR